MTLKEALDYANLSVKEGYTGPEDWEKLSDEELIKKAERLAEEGDSQL